MTNKKGANQKTIEPRWWEERCHTVEFGFDVDASKLIPFIKQVEDKAREEAYENVKKKLSAIQPKLPEEGALIGLIYSMVDELSTTPKSVGGERGK